jgi:hypothetical protein
MSKQRHHPTSSHTNGPLPWWAQLCRWLWKHPLPFLWSTLVINVAINIGSTRLIAPANAKAIPDTSIAGRITVWIGAHWLFSCLLLTISTALLLLTWLGSRWSDLERSTSYQAQISEQDRDYILRRLQLRYEQLLSQSLQRSLQIELGLTSRPAAIHNAVSLLLHLPEPPEQAFPSHTSIVDAYEQAQQELLILGEPGAGKSTLLLELASHLVEQAEQDPTQPLPVLLPLSSWATQRGSLQDWLIEQFARLYEISWNLSQQWILTGLVLPLLDGLDEMDEIARPECIVAINTYHREHVGPLVICSRTDEYESAAVSERLILHTAVVVQPLFFAQIDAHLATLGKPLAGLRAALRKNTALQAIATTPLMLQVLMLTYHDTSLRALSQKGPLLQKQIWTDYVQHMINRKGGEKRYPPMLTSTWLGCLARQLQAHNQTIFFLEQLQADWLPPNQRIFYQWSTRLVLLFFIWFVSALAIGLGFGLHYGQTDGPGAGLADGLFLGFFDGLLFTVLFSGIFIGPYLSKHYELEKPIEPIEGLSWSWKEFRMGLRSVYALLVGGLFVIAGLVAWLASGTVIFPIAFWLLAGLSIGGYGLSIKQQRPGRLTRFPNEGIRHSLKHGLLTGLLAWLLIGLPSGVFVGIYSGPLFGVLFGLFVGLLIGLLVGLDNGLNATLQHIILRFLLARNGTFPWKAVPFLEDATACILLRRVGGGYSFMHQLLLEYFANLETAPPSPTSSTAPPTKQISLP